jgi:Flp pilus assembly protein TadG
VPGDAYALVAGPIPSRAARGQSLVEFGLILPIFVLLLAAVIDVSRMVTINSAVVTASREGARYGAAIGDLGGSPQYVDCAGIRAAARNATDALIDLPDTQIRISYDNGVGTARTQACTPHGSGPVAGEIQNLDRVLVEVTATYDAITPVLTNIIGPWTVVSIDRRTIVTEIP